MKEIKLKYKPRCQKQFQKTDKKNQRMQAVKSKGFQIENLPGKALWRKGIRYRKNDRSVLGIPDFTIKKFKIAIFADSEFWHGKDWHIRKNDHKNNIEFWHKKITRNIERDVEVNDALKSLGWSVIVQFFYGYYIHFNFMILKE